MLLDSKRAFSLSSCKNKRHNNPCQSKRLKQKYTNEYLDIPPTCATSFLGIWSASVIFLCQVSYPPMPIQIWEILYIDRTEKKEKNALGSANTWVVPFLFLFLLFGKINALLSPELPETRKEHECPNRKCAVHI